MKKDEFASILTLMETPLNKDTDGLHVHSIAMNRASADLDLGVVHRKLCKASVSRGTTRP